MKERKGHREEKKKKITKKKKNRSWKEDMAGKGKKGGRTTERG